MSDRHALPAAGLSRRGWASAARRLAAPVRYVARAARAAYNWRAHLRRGTKSVLAAVRRSLTRARPWGHEEEVAAELHTRPPSRIEVRLGTSFYVAGWCRHPSVRITR